jgi:hypothetical protein
VAATPDSTGAIAGSVRAGGDRTPISDARVVVEGTRAGTATDADGRFRIAGIPAGRLTLVVGRIGYSPERVAVDVRPGAETEVAIVLRETAVVVAPSARRERCSVAWTPRRRSTSSMAPSSGAPGARTPPR